MGFKLLAYRTVGSTNSILKEMLKNEKPDEFTAIMADYQEKGRGQMGNSWVSDEGENILMSLILYPEFLAIENHFYISKCISVSIVDFCHDLGLETKIKWPNDIYCGHKKLAGILIENAIMGATISNSIVGIGLNVNQTLFPQWLPNPTSLEKELRKSFNVVELSKLLLTKIEHFYKLLQKHKLEQIDDTYFKHLDAFNTLAKYKDVDGEFEGRIIHVAADGELQVEKHNGSVHTYMFKEIEFL
jgi:BirA family biotin operon repressor/biotin-[acetyl-CoA-carboxylase] ligase